MGRYIVKIRDFYLEWSTIVDAPITYGLGLVDFVAYYRGQYGAKGMEGLQARLDRADAVGISALDGSTLEGILKGNRAGEGETPLTEPELYRKYCLRL